MSDDKNEISEVPLDTPSQEIQLDEDATLKALKEFRAWIKDHPEYPQKITDALLTRYLKVNDNNLEKALKLLEYNLTLRKSSPQLFANRKFLSDEIQNATNVIQFCPLPTLTKEKYRITIGGIRDPDASKFDYVNCLRFVLMLFDMRFSEHDVDGEVSDGEISIMDMKNMGWRHFMKAVSNFLTAKAYTNFLENASPMVIRQAHIINPSAMAYKMFTLFKPIMRKETLDVFHFHQNLESLYEHVPRELLPAEWGGNQDVTIEEVRDQYLKKMRENREFLENEDNWRISDKKTKKVDDDDDDEDFD